MGTGKNFGTKVPKMRRTSWLEGGIQTLYLQVSTVFNVGGKDHKKKPGAGKEGKQNVAVGSALEYRPCPSQQGENRLAGEEGYLRTWKQGVECL